MPRPQRPCCLEVYQSDFKKHIGRSWMDYRRCKSEDMPTTARSDLCRYSGPSNSRSPGNTGHWRDTAILEGSRDCQLRESKENRSKLKHFRLDSSTSGPGQRKQESKGKERGRHGGREARGRQVRPSSQ